MYLKNSCVFVISAISFSLFLCGCKNGANESSPQSNKEKQRLAKIQNQHSRISKLTFKRTPSKILKQFEELYSLLKVYAGKESGTGFHYLDKRPINTIVELMYRGATATKIGCKIQKLGSAACISAATSFVNMVKALDRPLLSIAFSRSGLEFKNFVSQVKLFAKVNQLKKDSKLLSISPVYDEVVFLSRKPIWLLFLAVSKYDDVNSCYKLYPDTFFTEKEADALCSKEINVIRRLKSLASKSIQKLEKICKENKAKYLNCKQYKFVEQGFDKLLEKGKRDVIFFVYKNISDPNVPANTTWMTFKLATYVRTNFYFPYYGVKKN